MWERQVYPKTPKKILTREVYLIHELLVSRPKSSYVFIHEATFVTPNLYKVHVGVTRLHI